MLAKTNAYLSDHVIFVHDFGMGEFAYKVDWCERKIERQHIAQHFTSAGSAYLFIRRLKENIRSRLNDHPALKQMLKTMTSCGSFIGKSESPFGLDGFCRSFRISIAVHRRRSSLSRFWTCKRYGNESAKLPHLHSLSIKALESGAEDEVPGRQTRIIR